MIKHNWYSVGGRWPESHEICVVKHKNDTESFLRYTAGRGWFTLNGTPVGHNPIVDVRVLTQDETKHLLK